MSDVGEIVCHLIDCSIFVGWKQICSDIYKKRLMLQLNVNDARFQHVASWWTVEIQLQIKSETTTLIYAVCTMRCTQHTQSSTKICISSCRIVSICEFLYVCAYGFSYISSLVVDCILCCIGKKSNFLQLLSAALQIVNCVLFLQVFFPVFELT